MKHLILAALLAVTVAGGAASAGTGDTFDSGDELVASTQTIGAIADIENMLNHELIDAVALEKTPGFLEVTGAVYARTPIQLIDERTSQTMDMKYALLRKHDAGLYAYSHAFTKLARSAPKLNTAPDVSPVNSSPLLC